MGKNDDIILFIDEIHTHCWRWWSHWFPDASNMFKHFLARGEIQCIATTLTNTDSILRWCFRKTFSKDNCNQLVEETITTKQHQKMKTTIMLHSKRFSACTNRYMSERFCRTKQLML
jgi:ATP-dependent Clp protease ATP-binding subunit ClpC